MKPFFLSLFPVVLSSCGGSTPAPGGGSHFVAPLKGPNVAAPLPTDDWRGQFVGTWRLEFRLDSIRGQGGSVEHWKPGSFNSTSGHLVIRDSTAGGWVQGVQSAIDVEFNALLGRPMSCYDPKPTSTGIEREGDRVRLTFTPGSADCGFSAYGKFFGDSLVGEWDESAFAGPSVTGRFRMVRQRF